MKNLTGSEKQIAWANEIRANYTRWYDLAIADLDDDIADTENDEETIEDLTEQKDRIVSAFARILDEKTSAAWWIDHRASDPAVAAGSCYKPDYLSPILRLAKAIR